MAVTSDLPVFYRRINYLTNLQKIAKESFQLL